MTTIITSSLRHIHPPVYMCNKIHHHLLSMVTFTFKYIFIIVNASLLLFHVNVLCISICIGSASTTYQYYHFLISQVMIFSISYFLVSFCLFFFFFGGLRCWLFFCFLWSISCTLWLPIDRVNDNCADKQAARNN